MDQFFGSNFVWFTGVVEDVHDPEKMNRVRVRVFGLHNDKKNLLPTQDLPWATVLMPTTTPGTSGLGESPHFLVHGSWVVGFFRDSYTAQDPVILGTIASMPANAANPNFGFNDPDGEYPRYTDEPDVNKLARGENTIPHTPDSKIGEPANPYAAEYPYNHVYETESGHVKEFDDTDGAERIREHHRSGTEYEVHPNGDRVVTVVGDGYHVVAGNDSVHVSGNVTVIVDGNANLKIGGNFNADIGGTCSVKSGGNMSFKAPRIDWN